MAGTTARDHNVFICNQGLSPCPMTRDRGWSARGALGRPPGPRTDPPNYPYFRLSCDGTRVKLQYSKWPVAAVSEQTFSFVVCLCAITNTATPSSHTSRALLPTSAFSLAAVAGIIIGHQRELPRQWSEVRALSPAPHLPDDAPLTCTATQAIWEPETTTVSRDVPKVHPRLTARPLLLAYPSCLSMPAPPASSHICR